MNETQAQQLVDANTKIIWICSPNNPTGFQFQKNDLQKLVKSFDGLVIQIGTANGMVWDDVPSSTYYVQLSGSTTTKFKKSNYLEVGDEIITLDNDNNTLSKVAITYLPFSLL